MEPGWHNPERLQARTWAIYGKSVPQLFLERVEARPQAIAFRYKDLGLYQEVTWRQYRDEVEAFALGLLALGVKPGDRIAVMGDACFEYFVADSAPASASARSPTASTRHARPPRFGTSLKRRRENFYRREPGICRQGSRSGRISRTI